MTDNTAEDFDVFDDSIDLEADDPVTEPEAEKESESESGEKEQSEPEGESKDEPKSKEEPEPPTGEDDKKESVPVAALKAERAARQQLQKELDSYKSKYESDEDEPDATEDPEAYREYHKKKAQQEFRQEIINDSRDRVMDAHPEDAQEKFDAFRLMAQGQPDLVKEYNSHPDPVRFAYDKGKEYLDGIYNKAYEKAKADLAGKTGKTESDEAQVSKEDERKATAAKAPDLTGSTAAGSNSEPLETMDEDIFEDSIFR